MRGITEEFLPQKKERIKLNVVSFRCCRAAMSRVIKRSSLRSMKKNSCSIYWEVTRYLCHCGIFCEKSWFFLLKFNPKLTTRQKFIEIFSSIQNPPKRHSSVIFIHSTHSSTKRFTFGEVHCEYLKCKYIKISTLWHL